MRTRVFSACAVSFLLLSAPAQAKDVHVSPTGTASGDGTAANPWNLATGLSHASIAPGDTVWLHGGTYSGSYVGNLTGTQANPIVVRSAPGEWARIDGKGSNNTTFEFRGAWTIYRDFEITNTDTNRWDDRPGMDVYGPNVKLVNLIIHDTGNNGFWSSATNSEIYGSLIYHTGFDYSDRGHGHAIYTQNATGTKKIADNILFGGYSFGIHAYTEGGSIQGFDIIGNVWFNSGVVSSISGHKDDCQIGGLQPADRVLLKDNFAWAIGGSTRSVQLGYSSSVANGSVSIEGNYFIGALKFVGSWSPISITGNTLCTVTGVNTSSYPNNTYLTVTPTVPKVFVRPNAYEAGRAHVIVYNWGEANAQPADLSAVLTVGDAFEIRNAQNYFANPVVTGTYDGSPVSIPQKNLAPVQPIGSPGSYDPADQTGSLFNVFVVRKTTTACTSASQCNDNNPCTTDACNQGTCTHTPIAGCCQSAAQCDDSDPCTSDSCSSNSCQHSAISGCCHGAGDCDDGNACTKNSCENHACKSEPVPGCCSSDNDCADNNPCTVDTCAVSTGTCSNAAAPGSCTVDTDCVDGDPCTQGRCTASCACVFDPVAGCNPDPQDGGTGGASGSGGGTSGTGGTSGSGGTIGENGGTGGDSNPDGGADSDASGAGGTSSGASGSDDGGCGCNVPGKPTAPAWMGLALFLLALRRRSLR
jgi:MYXO-CTERM domain-containing protein